jgi:hypothetical protein
LRFTSKSGSLKRALADHDGRRFRRDRLDFYKLQQQLIYSSLLARTGKAGSFHVSIIPLGWKREQVYTRGKGIQAPKNDEAESESFKKKNANDVGQWRNSLSGHGLGRIGCPVTSH